MLQIQPLQLWSGGLREPSGFVWAHGLAAPIGAEPPRRFTGGAKRIGRAGLYARRMIPSAILSATMSTGMFRLAQGMVGITEASHTISPSTPMTAPVGSHTAIGSPASPMRQVPQGCHTPPTCRRRCPRSAASSRHSTSRGSPSCATARRRDRSRALRSIAGPASAVSAPLRRDGRSSRFTRAE